MLNHHNTAPQKRGELNRSMVMVVVPLTEVKVADHTHHIFTLHLARRQG